MNLWKRIQSAAAVLKGREPWSVYAEATSGAVAWFGSPMDAKPDQVILNQVDSLNALGYAAIQRIAEDSSQIPIQLGRPTKGGFEAVDRHPALVVLDKPNEATTAVISRQDRIRDLLVEGNSFEWQKLRGTEVQAMVRLDPETVRPDPGPNMGMIASYTWTPPDRAKPETYRPEEIFHIRTRNPSAASYRGLAPTERLRTHLAIQQQMERWKLNQYFNGIPVELIFTTTEQLSEAGIKRARQRLEETFVGRHNQGTRFAILQEGTWNVKDLPRPSDKDLGFLDLYKFLIVVVSMVYGVPPNKFGIWTETSGLSSNADAQERLYWEDTIMGWHAIEAAALNGWLRRHWPRDRELEFRHDYSNVKALNSSFQDTAKVAIELRDKGIIDGNEARAMIGKPKSTDPLADQLLYQGRPLGNPPEPALPEPMPAEPAKRIEKVQAPVVPLRVVKSFDIEDILDAEDEKNRLRALVQSQILRMVREAGEAQLDLAGLAGAFNVQDPNVLEFVRTQIIELVGVVDTVNDLVRLATAEILEAGVAIQSAEARAAINSAFKQARESWRVDRIARTETHTAQEGGGFLAADQAGIEFKRWLTARDEKVRGLSPDDAANHDGIEQAGPIAMGLPFVDPKSGANLRFPGDRQGAVSGADTINCRCTWIADFSHLDAEDRVAAFLALRQRGFLAKNTPVDLNAAWFRKASQREKFEGTIRRLLSMHIRQMQNRALARFDAFAERSEQPAAAIS